MGFRHNGAKTAAAKMAAHLRNETEGAGAITPLGNLYVGVMARCGQHSRRRFIVEVGRRLVADWNYRQGARVCLRIADAEDIVDLTRADEGIDFRHLSF